jgi:phosphate:Na+ symporter
MIKDIYSANIEFISRAQAAAPAEYADSYSLLRRANMDIVASIKATKHLRKNMMVYSRSNNLAIRREYNRFRVRVGSVLRELAGLRNSEDTVVTLLSLDQIKVEAMDAAAQSSAKVDLLIREGKITSLMATSLINDGVYTQELVRHLLDVAEGISRARLPAGEKLSHEMSLQIEDIADIARSLDGGAVTEDTEYE